MPGPRTNAAFYAAPVAAAHAVFLSGNGPLVAVLREALARDDLDRARRQAHRVSLNNARLHPVVC